MRGIYMFLFRAGHPWGGGVDSTRFARPTYSLMGSRLAIRSIREPTRRLNSASWLTSTTD